MAWDFSTDPEFEEQLDWMRAFVREEIWPLETIAAELDQTALDRIYAPLQEEVKRRGLWAAHLPPDLGGQGFGQVKLGLMHEILGTSPFAPNAFGNQAPDSGNSEILALAGTRRAEGALAAPAAGRRPEVGLLDDRARDARARTRRSCARAPSATATAGSSTATSGSPRTPRSPTSSSSWRSPTPTRGPTSAPRCSSCPSTRPGVTIVRDVATMEHPQPSPSASSATTPRSSTRTCASAREALLGDERRGLPHRPAPARPRAHPPLHALARRRRGAPSTCSASARLYREAQGGRAGARSRRSRTGSPTRPRRCRRRG